MEIHERLDNLLSEDPSNQDKTRALIIVLGDLARSHIEKSLNDRENKSSSIGAIIRSRQDIHILFLNRFQYLFMYLIKFEAEEDSVNNDYNNLIFYGLDSLVQELNANKTVEEDENKDEQQNEGNKDLVIDNEQVRIVNLIYNASFRIKRKRALKDVIFIPVNRTKPICDKLTRIEDYWRNIC
ncbi:hypothetical protein Kpol_1018p52 [Vanderwaltozyma polyspora DSM 70294]|uniref:Uncharacterized protein n=1 Tax=Vanderwaltozyma polyspora (strain ATCC 22028 / DSM 70294 / BCRC 21397 / CBS 2163 / NBRC 10782 / NRRL Y-8283 / UCD 57-17) TaxID=436907 RepID=A7TDQ0_VANPO|nr:uncharacterized protein Kpol_1018p52 [Vanderwaltozyma polyspora DSM 70294]EDO19520.1 hypothetical protein Kpol_1018p52 [Vanderwaltozyma polyspora DSM 70294]